MWLNGEKEVAMEGCQQGALLGGYRSLGATKDAQKVFCVGAETKTKP